MALLTDNYYGVIKSRRYNVTTDSRAGVEKKKSGDRRFFRRDSQPGEKTWQSNSMLYFLRINLNMYE